MTELTLLLEHMTVFGNGNSCRYIEVIVDATRVEPKTNQYSDIPMILYSQSNVTTLEHHNHCAIADHIGFQREKLCSPVLISVWQTRSRND